MTSLFLRSLFLFALSFLLVGQIDGKLHAQTSSQEYREAIVKDWLEQERVLGRNVASIQALKELATRAQETLDAFEDEAWASPALVENLKQELAKARQTLDDLNTSKDVPLASPLSQYLALREKLRDFLLGNPKVTGAPIIFLKEERFTWQMLHEYLSYFYDVCGYHGGGIYVLKEPGKSFATESLTEGLFPRGVFQTLSLSYDAQTIYFSFADFSQTHSEDFPKRNITDLMQEPYIEDFDSNHMAKKEGKFNLYKMSLKERKVERLTNESEDDFDPVEAPDGSILFISTRRGGYGRCHGHYEPLNVHTLHRLNLDSTIDCLSWHETNEWQPTFLNDGRVVYTRWDYVDRNAAKHHGLWTTNPDGTNASILFGNYTYAVNACYQPKAIPGSNKILFVGGAHHLDVGGSLLAFDPSKRAYDPQTGEDDLSSIERLTPNIPLPEVEEEGNRTCDQYYFSPFPLSEDEWITSYSHEPLGGLLAQTTTSGKLGIYYGDRYGNLELLYQNLDSDESCLYPTPLTPREKPDIIPSTIQKSEDEKTGVFFLSNVYESLFPFPSDRRIKELRIIQLLPKGPDYLSAHPRIGIPWAANARVYLGTVPIEEDGSALFKAPAGVPLYFQAVDESGRAVQSMRSAVYLQPGENRGCVGCHEQTQTTIGQTLPQRTIASLRAPSSIVPGDKALRPISFLRFIQPILDAKCVRCHDVGEESVAPILTDEIDEPFTKSYKELTQYVKWYEWGAKNYREIVTKPGECGADISPITEIIRTGAHEDIGLTDEEYRKILLWCDLNAPFYGVYDPKDQTRQLQGEDVPLPKLQ